MREGLVGVCEVSPAWIHAGLNEADYCVELALTLPLLFRRGVWPYHSAPLMPAAVTYELLKADSATRARRGRIHTPHGAFDTPAFMPVGTQGTIKGVLPDH